MNYFGELQVYQALEKDVTHCETFTIVMNIQQVMAIQIENYLMSQI